MSDASSNGPPTQLAEQDWCRELAEQLVESARREGADKVDATVGISTTLSARARDAAVEDVTRASSRAAGVRVILDGRLGFATSAAAPGTPEEIASLARAAIDLARIATPSEHNVLPEAADLDPELLLERVAELDIWDEDIVEAGPEWAEEHALAMERQVMATPGVLTVREVAASTRHGIFALASTNGFAGAYGGTSCSLVAGAVAMDSGDKRQVESWWDAQRQLMGEEEATHVAQRAASRALRRKGARKVESTRAPVIFEHGCARTFVGAVLGAVSGELVSRGASFLGDKKGAQVFPPGFSLRDDPSLVGGLGSRAFDGEGAPVGPLEIIDREGRLCSFLHNARSASRMGERSTGHASRGVTTLPSAGSSNVILEGGTGDLDALIRETHRGLLVCGLLGHSPDMVTGEYSRGASGFWIEDGELAYPVEEVTVAGHMIEMMRGIDRVGADIDRRSSVQVPALRFSELAISGG